MRRRDNPVRSKWPRPWEPPPRRTGRGYLAASGTLRRRSTWRHRSERVGDVWQTDGMPMDGEYEPSAMEWVRDQVAEYEASGGTRANTLRDTGIPIIIVTMRGHSSGKVRKIALMRVEHEGDYA